MSRAAPPFPPLRAGTSAPLGSGSLWRTADSLAPWAVAVTSLGAVAILVAGALGPLPTGNDPGNWLAQGDLLISGAPEGIARPLVPALVSGLSGLLGPVEGARVVGIGSLLAVCAAVFVIVQSQAGPPYAAAAVLAIGLTRPLNETVAFGGYPQNFALAFGIAATWLACRYLDEGRNADRVALAGALCLCALSHHAYFVVCLVALGVAWASWLRSPASRGMRLARSVALAGPAALSVVALSPTVIVFAAEGYRMPLGMHEGGLSGALAYTFGDGREFLAPLLVLGGAFGAWGLVQNSPSPALRAAGALTLAGWALFLTAGEPRLLPLVFCAAVLGTAVAAAAATSKIGFTPANAGAVGVQVAAVIALALTAARANGAVYDYYRVLDGDLRAAIYSVDAANGNGAVAVLPGKDGWPLGWWFDGLGERPVLTGSDPRWLAFPDERRVASSVVSLIAPGMSSTASAAQARAAGVEFVAFDRRYWSGWEAWMAEPAPAVALVFQGGDYVVLRYLEAGVAAPAANPGYGSASR